jgi:hypothetical protein
LGVGVAFFFAIASFRRYAVALSMALRTVPAYHWHLSRSRNGNLIGDEYRIRILLRIIPELGEDRSRKEVTILQVAFLMAKSAG